MYNIKKGIKQYNNHTIYFYVVILVDFIWY